MWVHFFQNLTLSLTSIIFLQRFPLELFFTFFPPQFPPYSLLLPSPTGGMCLGFMGGQMEFSRREYKGDRTAGMTFIKILPSETKMCEIMWKELKMLVGIFNNWSYHLIIVLRFQNNFYPNPKGNHNHDHNVTLDTGDAMASKKRHGHIRP